MKILIIKLGALGDVIISTSIIKQILSHHHTDDLCLLTTPAFTELFTHFETLNVVGFERKGLLHTIKLARWIRKQRFDRIYDLQSNDRSGVLCALSGTPSRFGNHPRYPYHKHPEKPYIGQCHSFDRLNQIIESACIKPAKPLPFLPVPDKTSRKVSSWLYKQNLSAHSFAILHAGSSLLHVEKRWPYFKDLASILSQSLAVVWIGGDDDLEINIELSSKVGINATNLFSIAGLVALGKKAKFAVTNDSAPMHILSCSRIPVFGLFGPTYPRRTHALGQLDNIIGTHDHMAINDHAFRPSNIATISLDRVVDKLKTRNLI